MINKWISKRSRDVAGKFEIHRNQGDITETRNEQKIQVMSKPEISREIHLEFSEQESTGSCTFLPVDLSVNPSQNQSIVQSNESPDPEIAGKFFQKSNHCASKNLRVEWVLLFLLRLGRFHLIIPGNQKTEFLNPRLNSQPLLPLNQSGFDRIGGAVKNNGSHQQVL